MARIFTYGKLERIATKPGRLLPGSYNAAIGVDYTQAAMIADGNDVEFGEVVKITSSNKKSLVISRADDNLALANAGIVVRDVVGQRTIEAGLVEGVKANSKVPVSVIPMDAPQGWEVCIVVAEDVVAGTAVRVGGGEGTTVAGAGYKATTTTNTKAMTGWTYLTGAYQPTSGAGKCAIIKKI